MTKRHLKMHRLPPDDSELILRSRSLYNRMHDKEVETQEAVTKLKELACIHSGDLRSH